MDSTDASLYANRAAVYLKLRDIKANEDCSRALEIIMREKDLLKEMGQDDGRDVVRTRMQVKVLTRRGICKAELMGDLVNGAKDYEMALKLDPGNAGLCRDAELLQTRLQAA